MNHYDDQAGIAEGYESAEMEERQYQRLMPVGTKVRVKAEATRFGGTLGIIKGAEFGNALVTLCGYVHAYTIPWDMLTKQEGA